MTGPRLLHRIPSPDRANQNDAEWGQLAVCATVDLELFYVPGHPSGWTSDDGIKRAAECKAICEPCPLRDACLRFALTTGDAEGYFGGTTPQDRARMRRAAKRPSRSKETA